MKLYELKEKLAMVGEQLQAANDDIVAKASNPAVEIKEIKAAEERKAELQKRFEVLKAEHDKRAEEIKGNLRAQGVGPENNLIAAKAAFYRATITKQPIAPAVLAQLQAIPASDGTGGEHLLPTNLVTELLHEPFVKNPLRGHIRVSNIKGLEIPKIAFTLDDDSFIEDADTAQEIAAEGSKVSFGRNKFKVKVRIADTVLHGSDLDLVTYVESAIRSGLAAKEKSMAFAAAGALAPTEEHMSFYTEDIGGDTLIDTVEGATMFEAITNAIADLHEDYRENAEVCMRYADYVTMLKELSNNSVSLYGKQPEEVIGKPAFFSDSATIPIVGDFGYCRLNYDGAPIYDADKDVDKGEYIWVLTGWFDQRIVLKSAFRLAEVVPALPEGL